MATKIVEIFYFDAGGGHRNAMNALSKRISRQHPDWVVNPVDLQKVLEPIDPVYRLTLRLTGSLKRLLVPVAPRISLSPWQAQDIYNNALKHGTTQGLGTILPILQGFVRRFSPEIEALLVNRWNSLGSARPDIVVSVIPNFNRPMFRALRTFSDDIPYVTVVTDMVDYPPHFWMEDQDQFVICGTQKAARQAEATGFYADDRIFQVSGMILKDAFYDPVTQESPTRATLGLQAERPTALIMFGGNGSLRSSHTILGQFEKAGLGVQTIVMCGNNQKLKDSLKDRPHCHPVGFVNNVADYMRLADFFIGKPGPGSISEAVHMGLPVIVERNSSTLPQERPNVEWIRENGVGLVVKSFRKEIAGAAQRMLADLPRYRANIKANVSDNHAVFEIVDLIGKIMDMPRESGRRQRAPVAHVIEAKSRFARGKALLEKYRSRSQN